MLSLSLLLTATLGLAASSAQDAPPKALYLLFRGDARGVELYHAVRKDHEFRPLAPLATAHRVRLLDARGVSLAQVHLDLAGFCLDPAHVGDPPHVHGDVAQSHQLVLFAALPDLPQTARVVFERKDAQPGSPVVWREMGASDAAALRRLIENGRPR